MANRKPEPSHTYTVCVVGLSGTEAVKGKSPVPHAINLSACISITHSPLSLPQGPWALVRVVCVTGLSDLPLTISTRNIHRC